MSGECVATRVAVDAFASTYLANRCAIPLRSMSAQRSHCDFLCACRDLPAPIRRYGRTSRRRRTNHNRHRRSSAALARRGSGLAPTPRASHHDQCRIDRCACRSVVTMSFAFYGRVSTEDQQDPEASRNWQLDRSRQLIEPAGGVIVAEFFDIGQSRSLPWKRRPEAARLLEAFKDTGTRVRRGRDRRTATRVLRQPVRAHVPVVRALRRRALGARGRRRVDPESEAHDLVMSIFGGMGKGERDDASRSASAPRWRRQAATEGRFLGGRPPYGYRLADAGPHPEPGQGSRRPTAPPTRGRPDRPRRSCGASSTSTSPAHGLYAIAEGLTRDGILSPSASRSRTQPPPGQQRTARGERAPSARSSGTLATPAARSGTSNAETKSSSTSTTSHSATRPRCAGTTAPTGSGSPRPAHEPIITAETFDATHEHSPPAANRPRPVASDQTLASRTCCAASCSAAPCGRRMQGALEQRHAPYYRCRYPAEYALTERASTTPRPSTSTSKPIIARARPWLSTALRPRAPRRDLRSSSPPPSTPTSRRRHAPDARSRQRKLADCDATPRPVPQGARQRRRPRRRHQMDRRRPRRTARRGTSPRRAATGQPITPAEIRRH